MTTSTTIIIPGRETQVITGLTLSKADVIASFAGDIDLSSMVATEERTEDGITIAFANRTGTKGNDINVSGDLTLNVSGDVVINATRIEIPGREAQVIPDIIMGSDDVRAAFAGELDLAGMNCEECVEDDTKVIRFSNRTGTKGQTDIMSAIFESVQALQAATQSSEDEEDDEMGDYEDDDLEVTGTRIIIPGREAQEIQGIVLDAQMVKDSFSGEIDLSGYNVEEIENGDMLEVIFTARTGTKGE